VSVLSLQKSQWGDDFYLNAGVHLKDETGAAATSADACHIWWRPSIGNGGALIGSAADIELVVRHLALPWLDKLVDRPAIAEFIASPESEGVAIRLSAREWASRGS
jgi:hypothetical protein